METSLELYHHAVVKLHTEAYYKNAKLKVIYELFTTKYLEESKLDKRLIEKANDIFLSAEAAQCCNIQSLNKTISLVKENAIPELSDSEKVNIKNDFLKLVDKNINDFKKLYDYDVDPLKSIKFEELSILELEKSLDKSFSRYKENLIEISNYLHKMIVLRTKNVKELCENKIAQLKLKSEETNNKIKLLTGEAKKQVVTSKKAAKKVDEELGNKLNDLKEKLSELEMLSNSYKLVLDKPEYKYVLEKFKKAKQDLALVKSLSEKLKTQHIY